MKSSTEAFEYSGVATRLPVQDLNRARSFYASKLGLEPIEERPGGLLYRCGTGLFALFVSSGSPSGAHTQMGFEVTDLRAAVEVLRARGLVFEEYDVPGLKTVDGVAEVVGNIRAREGKASWLPGSGTARGTCSAWDNR
jgi:catechol 2,3-dioxygenase-like lactoylglutathione lyase family enzyme